MFTKNYCAKDNCQISQTRKLRLTFEAWFLKFYLYETKNLSKQLNKVFFVKQTNVFAVYN